MASEIHVISKKDLTKHETIAVDLALPALGPSSIRARTSLIGITYNNLSYAKLGDFLQWWSTWPVPLDAPAPYHNRAEWGIVPAWGFAKVLDSTIEAIPVGSLLYGSWPTSSHPVDLKLEPHDAEGHFREVSEHRQGLGSIYNRYNLVDESARPEEFRARCSNAFPIWNAGYVVNRFNFPTEFKPVHPTNGAGWSAEEADLSGAVVVNLSASSRTGRSITWNFARNRKPGANGPLALLAVASAPDALQPTPEAAFDIKTVGYSQLANKETAEWISGFKPSRVVVIDNGGPQEVTEDFRKSLADALPDAALTLFLIGGQPKLQTPEEFQASMALKAKWGSVVQLNTTEVINGGIAAEGGDAYWKGTDEAFERAVKEKYLGDMELVWGSGISGSKGVEKAWENIIQGTLLPNKAWVYRI
ncbi:hypothetical protein CSOJ01_12095 [Colletotrichum sojae]|uniref:Uncharacterized protein n=1 Tax=Colletotrichum sojae TaxID=2175907 RepID=A0A8H6MM19_9PEZI|nr:hypothetical protein CSOJ01_12095 [Colletotrichum sojae]